MKIETKFNLGEEIYQIYYEELNKKAPCTLCDGTGVVEIIGGKERMLQCPDCYGRKWVFSGNISKGYKVNTRPMTVSNVLVRRHRTSDQCDKDRTEYMGDETGIGSGQLCSERDLFRTEIEAQAECDMRNEGLINYLGARPRKNQSVPADR